MTTKVWCDGGSRGNPGPGAWACVFEDGTKLSGFLPDCTNNQAEYTAVIEAMTNALERGITDLHIIGDSQLVEGHLMKGWRVNKNKDLVNEAKALKARFDRCVVQAVPRSQNAEADALLNQVLDDHAQARRLREGR